MPSTASLKGFIQDIISGTVSNSLIVMNNLCLICFAVVKG